MRIDNGHRAANLHLECRRKESAAFGHVRLWRRVGDEQLASGLIPWGTIEPVNLAQATPNPAINAAGSVQAYWSADQTSYIVTFSGNMVQANVNNILSSDMINSPASAQPIIVAAYLSA
jgi:hypothetical protein